MKAFTFLAGLTAGAALGVLFAKRPGKQTRQAIRRKAEDSADQIASMAGKAGSRVKDAATKGREQIADALDAGVQAYREQIDVT